jgi:hypothetical protein
MEAAQSGITGVVPLERNVASAAEASEYCINDEFFIRDLERLKTLRSFLIEQAVCPPGQTALKFGQLNLLRFGTTGRMPTEEEWSLVEELTQSLFGLLTPGLRRNFLMGRLPKWVTLVAIGFAVLAVLALIISVLLVQDAANAFHAGDSTTAAAPESLSFSLILPYIIWLLSLGAIGSTAFIGMNALSVQEDATFDLTNERLMCLRIALGALFALVLSLPFGFPDFVSYCWKLISNSRTTASGADFSMRAIMLLLPFVLGFSTSLVIMILNRFVDAVQTFFGKAPVAPAGTLPGAAIAKGA